MNWYAVERDSRALEYVAKPATTLLLACAAATLHPVWSSERVAVVIALVLCLAGDVFLMLPNEDLFVAGLASFLVGHLVFIVGFVLGRGHDPWWQLTVPLAALALSISARPVLRGAVAQDARLRIPVVAYMAVIGVMLAASALPANRLAIAGAATFVLSDSVLARNRFVAPLKHGQLATMVTYHAALALIVLSLR
ncbi:MAG TPA: lysoplasmalogenase [Acidimicrobiales bacterium]|nr:lysoplasmalogenase [Acidimicrobiales bacterium]